jgi:hypothetical protein
MRGLVAAAILAVSIAAPAPATADAIADRVDELEGGAGYKVRVAAALALSKSTDQRAVEALATAVRKDPDAAVRRVSALALKKVVTANTRKSTRALAIGALEHAAASDKDKKVRKAAARALAALETLLRANAPAVFVRVTQSTDKTKKAPDRAVSELDKVVRAEVVRASKDYAVDWPDGLPTGDELSQLGTRAFIVTATVAKLKIDKTGGRAEIACTIEIRVAPWAGTDGEERWVANQTGKATGNGKATTASHDKAVAGGVVDCVGAVGEQLTSDQIVPFIRRLASSK